MDGHDYLSVCCLNSSSKDCSCSQCHTFGLSNISGIQGMWRVCDFLCISRKTCLTDQHLYAEERVVDNACLQGDLIAMNSVSNYFVNF